VFKVKVDDEEARAIVARIEGTTKKHRAQIQSEGYGLGLAARQFILNRIAEDLGEGIGPFMAARTKIEITVSGSSIILNISGMSEGEAGHPPRSDGTVPQVSSPDVNLWMVHEYGRNRDESQDQVTYRKDIGGKTVQRYGTAITASSPYIGSIRSLVQSLAVQLNPFLVGVAAISASNIAAENITKATGGKVQIDRSARAALRRAGVSATSLAQMGVHKVTVTSRGQILVIGKTPTGAGRFMSSKSLGIPTSINRR